MESRDFEYALWSLGTNFVESQDSERTPSSQTHSKWYQIISATTPRCNHHSSTMNWAFLIDTWSPVEEEESMSWSACLTQPTVEHVLHVQHGRQWLLSSSMIAWHLSFLPFLYTTLTWFSNSGISTSSIIVIFTHQVPFTEWKLYLDTLVLTDSWH